MSAVVPPPVGGAPAPAPEAAPSAPRAAEGGLPVYGLLLLLSNSLLWGVSWPLMKIVLDELAPWNFRFVIVAAGGLGLLLGARLGGHRLRFTRAEVVPLVVIGFFSTTVWGMASTYGLSMMAPGRASILAFTMPLWATIMSVFVLGSRITPIQVFGLALGLAGLAILVAPDLLRLDGARAWLGPALMLLAAFAWAAGTIATKAYALPLPAISIAGWQQLIGGVPIMAVAFFIEDPAQLLTLTTTAYVALAFSVLVGTVWGLYAWFKVVSLFPAHVAAVGVLGVPVVGTLSSTVIYGSPLLLREVVALLLVVTALTVVLILPAVIGHRQRRRRHPA